LTLSNLIQKSGTHNGRSAKRQKIKKSDNRKATPQILYYAHFEAGNSRIVAHRKPDKRVLSFEQGFGIS
jgi:hypothetical protein